MYSYGLGPPQAFDLVSLPGKWIWWILYLCWSCCFSWQQCFFCHMMKWSHLVQLPVPTKPFQGPCSAPLKAFDLQIRYWESLAQFRKRNWPLTFSLTSYVSHERNHTQKACFAKILRGPYWYKQSWWGANSPTSSFCILATRHVSWQTGVDCLFLLNQKPGHAFLYKPKF